VRKRHSDILEGARFQDVEIEKEIKCYLVRQAYANAPDPYPDPHQPNKNNETQD